MRRRPYTINITGFPEPNHQRYIVNNVYEKLNETVIEDPLSAAIRHRIAQGYNISRLPKVPPLFRWEFVVNKQCYFLMPPSGPPIVNIGIEWISWCTTAAIHQLVTDCIERYYRH